MFKWLRKIFCGQLEESICELACMMEEIMATLAELETKLDTAVTVAGSLRTGLDEILAFIATLKQQQGPVTQAQLDTLDAKAQQVVNALTEIDALDESAKA